jgi:hypothetical protein
MRDLRSSALYCLACVLCGCGASGHPDRNGPTSPDTTAQAGSGGSGSGAPDAAEPALPRPDKVDLLLMLDNSRSMDVKHSLFEDAVQQLLRRLRSPDCVAASGDHSSERDDTGGCVSGRPEFEPVTDIHVAVISSSLGDGGDNLVCRDPEDLDMAHTLGSTARGAVASMNSNGFLEWRAGADEAVFTRDLQQMIAAVGQNGCGYEASLEAWYRFLVEPAPYTSLVRVACNPGDTATDCMAPAVDEAGHPLIDQAVLEQRAAFLRPDSLLLIVSLTDENDCSIRVGGDSWRIAALSKNMPRAASAGAVDPNSVCCYACGSSPPAGCSADPACDTQPTLTPAEDGTNLRCQDQKRRFGADFLYPTERYVRALTDTKLCASQPSLAAQGCPGETFDNPLFAGGRPAALISFASVVGVPWQDIASPESSAPASFHAVADLQPSEWDRILGRPSATPPLAPADPFMQESDRARAGIEIANPINGREYDTAQTAGGEREGTNDLEYACTFPLPAPIDCAALDRERALAYDCSDTTLNDTPLCEQVPGQTPRGQIQYFSKAYPGLRHLEVLQGVSARGGNATLGSICARNTSDDARPDFGYRPAMQALLERVTPVLRAR